MIQTMIQTKGGESKRWLENTAISMINNKIKRTELHVKLKRKEKVEKRCKAQTRDAKR